MLDYGFHTHRSLDFLHRAFIEDTATRGRFILGELDELKDRSRNRVCRQQVFEEAGDVPQTMRLVTVNSGEG